MKRYAAMTAATLAALALLAACSKQEAAPVAAEADDESELTGGDKVRPGAVMPETEGTTPPAEAAPAPAPETTEAAPAT